MIIIHDGRLPDDYKKALSAELPAAEFLPFKGAPGVYDSISCHPDIWLFQIAERTVVHAPGLSEGQLNRLREAGIELIRGAADPSGGYPGTAGYNAALAGDVVFHNLKYTDPVIHEKLKEKGIRAVDCAQGYTRCSFIVAGEGAVITSDRSIAEAASAEDMHVLLLSAGSVILPGEKYGFIGGACGRAPGGTVVFLGDLKYHPEYQEIKDFLKRHDTGYIELKGLPLYDAGSLFILGHK